MLKLAENEIRTLDDLAGLDDEELIEFSEHGLNDATEADITAAARAHCLMIVPTKILKREI